ncbi:MAG: hypothetical protein CMD27_02775 [Flavobacteriales bacterium]|nr:hypothetical protein [Flavobacteriales bacterium]|tara:strand:+ start:81 stop:551 length:471 start_codon:yes stop_codon:yes gene_type:complete
MKFQLSTLDYKEKYNLLAFRCSVEDYRLAYFLNKYPNFLFQRMPKDLHCVINGKNIYFSTFEDNSLDYEKSCYLISNKSLYREQLDTNNLFNSGLFVNTAFLIPELSKFDFFLKLIGIWKKSEIKTISKNLNKITEIESKTHIDLNKLKSINNLVF